MCAAPTQTDVPNVSGSGTAGSPAPQEPWGTGRVPRQVACRRCRRRACTPGAPWQGVRVEHRIESVEDLLKHLDREPVQEPHGLDVAGARVVERIVMHEGSDRFPTERLVLLSMQDVRVPERVDLIRMACLFSERNLAEDGQRP